MGTDMSNAGRPVYYPIRDAAWILGVEPSTVARAIRFGTLRAVWRHGRLVVSATALIRLLEGPTGNEPQTGETGSDTRDGGGESR